MKKNLGLFKTPVVEDNRIRNLVPGTLVYKGDSKKTIDIECIDYDNESYKEAKFSSAKTFSEAYESLSISKGVRFIIVTGLGNVPEIEALGRTFGLNNLMLEQVLNITKYSSFIYEEDYIFADLQMIYFERKIIQNENISIYAIDNTVIVFQERKNDILRPLKERLKMNQGTVRQRSAYYLYYALLDLLVDNYLDVMGFIRLDILQLEEMIVNEQSLDKKSIHSNRKRLLHFKLAIGAFEKIIQKMTADKRFKFDEKDGHVRNLESHLKEVANELILQTETVDALYENYMLNNSDDMNAIMTTLTLFSAIFIPLSFLTGLFGMNFQYIPGLEHPFSFMYFGLACLVMVTGMLTFFKVKKWF